MENVIVSLITIAVILSGGMMLAQSAVLSADHLATDWKGMEVRAGDLKRTVVAATQVVDQGAQGLQVTVRNQGQRVLGSFSDWDVVVQYYQASGTYYIKRLAYVSGTSPGNDEWAVSAIKLNGNPETYQKNLLDPGEDLFLIIKPNPPLGPGKTIQVVIATPNGVTTSIQFTK